MSDDRHPYIVTFTHDRKLPTIDHSKEKPGPEGKPANRAGYTSVHVKPEQLRIDWVNEPKGADGRVAIYASAVHVNVRLTDYMIAITSNYKAGRCAYRATRRHEIDAHIKDPIRIFYRYRKTLVARLSLVKIPTTKNPERVHPDLVDDRQEVWAGWIKRMVQRTHNDIVDRLKRARDHHDSDENYRAVYAQCTPEEWRTGP